MSGLKKATGAIVDTHSKDVDTLVALGFSRSEASQALEASDGSFDDAVDYLLSNSIESGNIESHGKAVGRVVDAEPRHQTPSLGMMAISNDAAHAMTSHVSSRKTEPIEEVSTTGTTATNANNYAQQGATTGTIRQQVFPGAVAMPGIDGMTAASDDEYATTAPQSASHQTRSSMVPVTARLVHGSEEDVEFLQEELQQKTLELQQIRRDQENAPVAEIVTDDEEQVQPQNCPRGSKRRQIALVVVTALAIAASVLGVTLKKSSPPPQDLNVLLSSVSFDGGEALRTPSTPQNRAFNWLANNNTHLDSYSDDQKIQRYALAVFLYSLRVEWWEEGSDRFADLEECDWTSGGSMICVDGSVTELAAGNNDGSIPAELGLFSQLGRLSIGNVTGTIPSGIGGLTSLTSLGMGNNISGTIPTEIGFLSNLFDLSLDMNNLTGTIPTEIGMLTNLNRAPMYRNMLSGTIPTEIGHLAKIDWLNLSENYLTGTIPSEIGTMSKLDELELNDNKLTGTIPSVVAIMTSLSELVLYNNSLSGDFTCPDFIPRCQVSCKEGGDECRSLP